MESEALQKILIVEDEPLIAMDIRKILLKNNYNVIGVAHDSESALDMIASRLPNLILMDINIEGVKDGIQVAAIVKDKYDIPVIFLTSYSDDETLERAQETLPYAFIVKPFEDKNLKSAVKIALFNYNKNKTQSEFNEEKLQALSTEKLTKKECSIIKELLKGISSASIASKEFVSINTVKFHLKNIYRKYNVSNRSELISLILNSS